VHDVRDALDLLLEPRRLIATLRRQAALKTGFRP
jgi:hypothetical protein